MTEDQSGDIFVGTILDEIREIARKGEFWDPDILYLEGGEDFCPMNTLEKAALTWVHNKEVEIEEKAANLDLWESKGKVSAIEAEVGRNHLSIESLRAQVIINLLVCLVRDRIDWRTGEGLAGFIKGFRIAIVPYPASRENKKNPMAITFTLSGR